MKNSKWLVFILSAIAFIGFPLTSARAADVPQSFTLDGQLFSDAAATTPLLDGSIQMSVQVLDEDKVCILYEETQSLSTLASQGYFTAQVGTEVGSIRRPVTDSGNSMATVFQNITAINGKLLSNGSPCSTAPGSGKRRFVRITIAPATMGSTARVLSPDLTIDSVPNAIVAERAESLQGLRSTDVLKVNTASGSALSQANLESLFTSSTRFNSLTSVVDGTSTNYMRSNSSSGAQLPVLPGAPTMPPIGAVWFDSSDSKIKFQTSVGPASLGTGSGTVTSVGFTAPPELTVAGAPVTSAGTIAVTWAAQMTNKVLAAPDGTTGTPTFRVLTANDIPNLPWTKITTLLPTTLLGYGITDAVKNAGGTPSLQSGLDAGKGAAGTAGRIWISTDTKLIYRDNGATWDQIAGASSPTGAAGGDLAGTYPNPTVAKLQGVAVSSTAPTNGQILKYGAATWAPGDFSIGDLKTVTGTQQFAGSTTCTASQTLTWSSLTDTFTCTNITGLDGATITTGTVAAARLPTSASAWTVTGGDIYRATGSVGIGTAAPGSALDVKGTVRISGATSGYVGFAVPTAAGSATYTWPSAAPGSSQVLQSDSAGTLSWVSKGTGDALTTNPLSQFAATTSAQLAGVISDETGSGALVFGTSPTLAGVPVAPTAAADTSTTQIATTAYVTGQASAASPLMDGTTDIGTSLKYARADHVHPTDTSRSPLAGSSSITTLGTVTAGVWNATTIAIANGGTGATTAAGARTNLGLGTSALLDSGNLIGNVPVLGTGGISPNKMCTGDATGANIICTSTPSIGDALTTNPLSQFAATTSAQLAGVISDETGSGALVFGTGPTFTTNIYSPMIVGGTAINSTLTYRTTTAVGAAGADHVFQVGNNGATEAMRILNNANVGIGTSAPGSALDVKGTVRISGATSGYVGFAVPAAAGSATYTWPAAAPGSNMALQSDSSGMLSWVSLGGGGDAFTTNPLSQFAATTSAQLSGVISDETGSGALVFGTSPTIASATLTTPTMSSPTMTGTPVAPTAAADTSTTQVATTAFVTGQASASSPVMDGTTAIGTSLKYARADHVHPSDTSRSPLAGSASLTTVGTVTTGTWNASPITVPYGGTGATTAAGARTNLGLGTAAVLDSGNLVGNVPVLGTGGLSPNKSCVADATGTNIICTATPSSGDALTTSPLSQFAATTSAQLAGVISDETGSGQLVFATTPTFNTNIFSPIIIGGTGTTSTLRYRPTSGVGAAGADHIFQVGNNGATEAMRILNSGAVGIGTPTPGYKLDVAGDINITGSFKVNGTNIATGGGTVTSVTGSGPINVATGTTTPVISISTATTSVNGMLSAADWNTFNNKLSTTLTTGKIWVGNAFSVATAVSASGDTTLANTGAFTVTGLQGRAVASTAPNNGQVLKYSSAGTTWAPSNFSISDLLTAAGAQQFAGSTACTAAQTLTWSSLTDTFTCTNIAGLDGGVITTGTVVAARLPSSASAWTVSGSDIYRASGLVGIGAASPRATLDVSGAITSAASVVNATSTVDFSAGNIQHTTANCGSFSLQNLKDGGSYMFVVKGTTAATCSFTAYSDNGVTSLTVHLPPGHGATTVSTHTIYNVAVSGGDAYFAWTPGY